MTNTLIKTLLIFMVLGLLGCDFADSYKGFATVKLSLSSKAPGDIEHAKIEIQDSTGSVIYQGHVGAAESGVFLVQVEAGEGYKIIWKEYFDYASYLDDKPWMTASVTQDIDETTSDIEIDPLRIDKKNQSDFYWDSFTSSTAVSYVDYLETHGNVSIEYNDDSSTSGKGYHTYSDLTSATYTFFRSKGNAFGNCWWNLVDDLDTTGTTTTYYLYDVTLSDNVS